MYSNALSPMKRPVGGPWSLRYLMSSFKTLVQQAIIPLKICLLIDGLDEFDGDHDEIADLFKDAAACHNIKVCLSSRPWVVFQESFYNCPTL